MSMLELSIMQDRLEENQEKEEREFQEYYKKLVEEMKDLRNGNYELTEIKQPTAEE